jgi:hypothetical protein
MTSQSLVYEREFWQIISLDGSPTREFSRNVQIFDISQLSFNIRKLKINNWFISNLQIRGNCKKNSFLLEDKLNQYVMHNIVKYL